jgi:hypothetical protein
MDKQKIASLRLPADIPIPILSSNDSGDGAKRQASAGAAGVAPGRSRRRGSAHWLHDAVEPDRWGGKKGLGSFDSGIQYTLCACFQNRESRR